MAFSPLITRLYGPDAYGVQGVFMAIAGFMATFAAMSYPVSMVLPKSDADAKALARLSIYIAIGMVTFVTVMLFFFGAQLLALINAEEISVFIFLIPVFMIASVLSAISGQWVIRKKNFLLAAKVSVLQAIIVNAVKAGLGFVHPVAFALIVINTLSGLLSAVLVVFGLRGKGSAILGKSPDNASGKGALELARRYRDFAVFRTPQNLLNTASHSLPVVMLATYFGTTAAGFYTIASTVMAMPAGLVAGSVMQVFYPRINEAICRGENVKTLIVKATIGLALTGALPFVVTIIAGPILFAVVFGAEWRPAGIYAQWLSIWVFFQYINKPAVAAIPSLGLQRGLLIYEVFSTGSKVLALYLGYVVYESDVAAIALFSVFGAAAYASLISWVVFRSGKSATVVQAGRI